MRFPRARGIRVSEVDLPLWPTPERPLWGGPGGLPHAIPQQLLPPQYGTAPGARGAGKKKGGGAYVSHSAAEKQRRDRINSLIDELRGIVPPQGGGQDNSKRPKHAVLNDTIVLLKRLLSEPNNQAALTEWQNGEANGAASPDPSSDLEDGDAKVAISAVPGDGNIHKVKVVCLDQYGEWIQWRMRRAARRGARGGLTPGGPGLLHILTAALKSLDLLIQTASISTSPEGIATDVFTVDSSNCKHSQEEIVSAIKEALADDGLGDKRKRSVAE